MSDRDLKKKWAPKLRALVRRGLLSRRACDRYLLPADELGELLQSDKADEVTDDLNEVLNAVMRAAGKHGVH